MLGRSVKVSAGAVVLFLVSCMLAAPSAQASLSDLTETLVTTVRVPGGAAMTDAELRAIAEQRGSIEVMRFWKGRPIERIIVRLGDPEFGCPGFTSMNRKAAAEAVAKGAVISNKNGEATVSLSSEAAAAEWTLPQAGEPFQARLSLQGKLLYTETRRETVNKDGETRPDVIRVDGEDGEVIFQVFTYDGASPAKMEDPYAGFGVVDESPILVEAGPLDPGKAVAEQGVLFYAQHGFSLDWDSGFWPGGGTSPGAFPLQVRLGFGVGWARGAEVTGSFILDGNTGLLSPGPASGAWWVDYGAELRLDAAISIPFLPAITLDVDQLIADNVDFIPTFDGRFQRTIPFNSYLLSQGSPLREESPRYNIFTFDVVDAILAAAGVSLPPWIPLSAGIRLDGSVSATGTLKSTGLMLADGTTFTSDGQWLPVDVVNGSFSTTADLQAQIDLEIALNAYPALFAEIVFMRFDLPVGELSFPIPVGSVAMDFQPASLNLVDAHPDVVPDPEGEGEGTVDPNEGEAGEGEGEGETVEGETTEGETAEGEGEGVTEEGEGEPEPLTAMPCTTFDYSGEAIVLEDMIQQAIPIQVNTPGLVEDLSLALDVYHNKLSDLVLYLESPAGTRAFLLASAGGSTAHLLQTQLWDGATKSVREGVGPFAGRYRAQDPLSVFKGENAQGLWRLFAYDAKVSNLGIINDWSLTVNPCNMDVAPPEPIFHSVDYAPRNNKISLTELLRVIQFYNYGEHACDENGEDGYNPGSGWHTCPPHTADYAPVNWNISLSELLRVIQFFNAGSYHESPASEDGFAPGLSK